jgi:ABC-2 type transport system permease protein
MIALAKLGVRLRWTITRNSLKRRGAFLFVVSTTWAGLGAIAGFSVLALSRGLDPGQRRLVLTFACSMIALAWVFGPLLVGGADETVDPAPLALLPLTRPQLAAVIGGAAVSSPATLALEIALLGGIVAGWSTVLCGAVSVLAVLGLFLFGLGLARSVAALMGMAQRTRRGRDLTVLIAALAGVTLWVGSQSIGPLLKASHGSGGVVVRVMSWLPPGWAARALLDAHDRRPLPALGWSLLLLVLGTVLVRTWAVLTVRLLVGERNASRSEASATSGLWPRATDAGSAAMAKAWRYQWRSPMRRSQLLIGTIMGIGLVLLQVLRMQQADPRVAFMGLAALLFSAATTFNVIGFDAPSLWLETVASGELTSMHLRTRLLALVPTIVVPVVGATMTVGIVTGQWREVPAVLLVTPAAALCLLGAGAVVSATMPLPMLDGNNPFSRPTGANGCSYGLAVLLALATLFVLLVPVVGPVALANGAAWGYLAALAGIAWGWFVWHTGVRLGARRLHHRTPELLAELTHRAAV